MKVLLLEAVDQIIRRARLSKLLGFSRSAHKRSMEFYHQSQKASNDAMGHFFKSVTVMDKHGTHEPEHAAWNSHKASQKGKLADIRMKDYIDTGRKGHVAGAMVRKFLAKKGSVRRVRQDVHIAFSKGGMFKKSMPGPSTRYDRAREKLKGMGARMHPRPPSFYN